LRITGRTEGGVYPDGLAYDPNTKHVFVSDEHGNTDTVIDTHSNKRVATIELFPLKEVGGRPVLRVMEPQH
jgi:YVTN family beta-propeller protein